LLEVRFRRDSRQRLSSVFASGHAAFSEHGTDIVCAAASAILQCAWLGAQEYAGVDIAADRASGHLVLRWPEHARDDDSLRAIMSTAELGIEQIAHQFPQYVRIVKESESAP